MSAGISRSDDGRLFTLALREWASKFTGSMDALARQTCQNISLNVVTDTPVDTGFLRSSWQPSIGEPQVTEGDALGAAGASGRAMSAVGLVCAGLKAGDTYFMVNNAKYARRLEFGFVGEDSLGRKFNQMGRYFVSDNMARAPAVVEQLTQELKQ